MALPFRLAITDPSEVGAARRRVRPLAEALGFDEAAAGRLALVVTEIGNNLVKFARGGELLVRPLESEAGAGLELLAVDRGPGIVNMTEALRDGHSTAGTPGTGLGAIRRLADEFDLHSLPGAGTALMARLWARGRPAAGALDLGAVSLPMPGETSCGDAWAVQVDGPRFTLLVVDGLGHGGMAAEAAGAAVRSFQASAGRTGTEILERMHAALRSTRGAAVGVAAADPAAGMVRFTGVGNIAAAVVTAEQCRSMVSHNGIVGHQMRKVQSFEYPWPPGSTLIVHSDGLATSWRLDRYPGLLGRSASLLAGRLYSDFRRGSDDVTVLAARERSPAGGGEGRV